MADLAQQVVAGLAAGAVYGGLAVAIVVVYKATRVVNFAQGEMGMVAAYVAWTLLQAGVPYWAAAPLALAVAFAGGVVVYGAVIRPAGDAPGVTLVIVTLGLLVGLNGLATAIWSGELRSFPSAFPSGTVRLAGVSVSRHELGAIAVTAAAAALLYGLLRATRLGRGFRAVAADPATSRLLGVPIGGVVALAWGLAAALGALAAMLAAPALFLDPAMMRPVLLYALAAAVLGGLDSLAGALAGGLALGVVLSLLTAYVEVIGPGLRLPAALALVLVVLLVRPSGLLGERAVRGA